VRPENSKEARTDRRLAEHETGKRRTVVVRRHRVPAVAAAGSTVHADEASNWDVFARLRRMVSGQHHHVSARYLHQYANEAAWKEDHRRMDNGALTRRVLGLALVHPVSRNWKGYWQRSFVK
jgi:hypothetical protein